MDWSTFVKKVYETLDENDSFIEKVLWKDKDKLELECVVLEGGYEPCRMKFWADGDTVEGGYR